MNKVINYLKLKRKYLINIKKVTCVSKDVKFGLSSGIALVDGSSPKDVQIGHHVWLYGTIFSQSGGKVCLGNFVKIGPGSKLTAVEGINVGDYTAMAQNVTISDNNNHPISPRFRLYMRQQPEVDDSRLWKHSVHAQINIGRNVWIGDNVRIQKGVTIGDNSIIAANSIVTKNVPPNCIAAGNPARIVKTDIDQIAAPNTCVGYNHYTQSEV